MNKKYIVRLSESERNTCMDAALLAEELVALKVVDSISHETVRQRLKKTR
jgi:hypothetical protein